MVEQKAQQSSHVFIVYFSYYRVIYWSKTINDLKLIFDDLYLFQNIF